MGVPITLDLFASAPISVGSPSSAAGVVFPLTAPEFVPLLCIPLHPLPAAAAREWLTSSGWSRSSACRPSDDWERLDEATLASHASRCAPEGWGAGRECELCDMCRDAERLGASAGDSSGVDVDVAALAARRDTERPRRDGEEEVDLARGMAAPVLDAVGEVEVCCCCC